jgi:hypothetical protein
MRSICISILAAISIILFSSTAASLTIPSDKNKPAVSEEVRELFQGMDRATVAKAQVSEVSGGGKASRGDRDKDRPAIVGDLVQIKKEIIPSTDNGYLVGDSVGVFVEILCKQNLDSISIKEFVDNDLNMINVSQYCYRLKTSDEISDYGSGFNKEYFKDGHSKREEDKIHPDDMKRLTIGGSNCIYDKGSNISYRDNLINFLSDDLGISWAKNARTDLRGNALIIADISNNSDNITLSIDEKKEYALLKFKNNIYKFFVKCESVHCPVKTYIDLDDEMNATERYALEKILNLTVYYLQNDFDIKIINPRMNERYTYWYFIKLNKPGNFDSNTAVLTSYGGVRNVPDVESSLKIKVSDPSPEVNIRLNKLNLLKKEKFNLIYEIKYPTRPNFNNTINVNFPRLNDYYSFINITHPNELEHDLLVPYKLDEENHVSIPKKVIYNDSGEYYLPEIMINGVLFPFQKDKVFIDTRFERYAQFITLIFAVAAFFFKDFFFPPKDVKDAQCEIMKSARSVLIILSLISFVILVFWFLLDTPISFLRLP